MSGFPDIVSHKSRGIENEDRTGGLKNSFQLMSETSLIRGSLVVLFIIFSRK
jgi:hypothetical protein